MPYINGEIQMRGILNTVVYSNFPLFSVWVWLRTTQLLLKAQFIHTYSHHF